jgi:hypothetical protein
MSETGAFMRERRQAARTFLAFDDFTWVEAPRRPRRGGRARGVHGDELSERPARLRAGVYGDELLERPARLRARASQDRVIGPRPGGAPLRVPPDAEPLHALSLAPGADVASGADREPRSDPPLPLAQRPAAGVAPVSASERAAHRPRRPPRVAAPRSSPDRIALWAVVLGILLLLIAAASAHGAIVPAAGRTLAARGRGMLCAPRAIKPAVRACGRDARR